MADSVWIAIIVTGLYVAWVLVPLIPSILVYRMFPDTKVSAAGPLSNLNINTSGAFAAYLIVLLVTIPFISDLRRYYSSLFDAVWVIEADMIIQDQEGKRVEDPSWLLSNLQVTLEPDPNVRTRGNLQIKIPATADQDSLPQYISIKIPDFGGKTIEIGEESNFREFDRVNRRIKIMQPVVVRERPVNQ